VSRAGNPAPTHWIRVSLLQDARWNALDPGFHCVRTHWIRGFMAFWLARRIQILVLMVPAWPESGFGNESSGWAGWAGTSAGGGRDVSGGRQRVSQRREGYAGRWEVKLDNIAALAAEREQLARTPEGGSRGGGFGVAPG
jgi:hypothetical protein